MRRSCTTFACISPPPPSCFFTMTSEQCTTVVHGEQGGESPQSLPSRARPVARACGGEMGSMVSVAPTTLHRRRSFPSTLSGVPLFVYDPRRCTSRSTPRTSPCATSARSATTRRRSFPTFLATRCTNSSTTLSLLFTSHSRRNRAELSVARNPTRSRSLWLCRKCFTLSLRTSIGAHWRLHEFSLMRCPRRQKAQR